MNIRVLVAVVLTACAAVPAAQEREAPALQPFRGVVVVDDRDAVPLRRVRIDLSVPGVAVEPVFTDDQGKFESHAPRGAYTVTFTKPGYVPQTLRREADSPVEQIVRMPRGAVISGRVLDEFGDALLAGVRLRGGGRQVTVIADPLGGFRIGSLPAGRYEVAAVPGLGSLVRPGGEQTVSVEVGAGEEVAVVLQASPVANLGFVKEFERLAARERAEPDRQEPAGVIRGRVTRSDGFPVGGANVNATGVGQQDRSAMTDSDGRYAIDGLEAGTYTLHATKSGPSYFSEGPDQKVTLREGQVQQVNLVMERPPVVTGVVRDEYGEPLEGITVELWQRRSGGGRAVLLPASMLTARGRTDDRGRYLLLAAPGMFYVVAREGDAANPVSYRNDAVRVYYPGTAKVAEATPLRREWGRDATGIDITFLARPRGRVHGIAVDSSGQPLTAPIVLIESYRSGVVAPAPRSVAVGADGSFSFSSVAPGDYVLQAIVPLRSDRRPEFAMAYVTVPDGDAAPVTMRTSLGTTVNGRAVFESASADVNPRQFVLSVEAAEGDYANASAQPPSAVLQEDGTFEMYSLHGPLRFTAGPPDGWWLKSVNIGIIDAADQPFTFGGTPRVDDVVAVFADDGGQVTGRVMDRGTPTSTYFVLLFSTDRNRWWSGSAHVKLARPAPDGTFRAGSVPPGDYFIAAVDIFDAASEWLDADILAGLVPPARRISVRERQSVAIELDLLRRER